MNPSVRRQFQDLACARSPENLCGDGEFSRREVQRRHKAIMAEWHELERLLGRRVSLDEIERGFGDTESYGIGYMQGRGAA